MAGILFGFPSLAHPADVTELSIAEAGQQLRLGSLTSVELVRAYLGRIERLDGQLNSFITVAEEQALARARSMDQELRSGRWRGPLHGIPIALKDNIDTAGIRTSAASAVYSQRIPDEDAEIARRLSEAGAVILGKLNMHEFAFGATSAVSHYGAVRNPWNLDRVPGGSSGGSAAAIAARLCAGAIGTDTGGSIRIPAAHCGIVGLKPTHGLASIRGIVPLSTSFDHAGPMCRTAGDAALMLQAIAGFDPDDAFSIEAPIPNYFHALQRRTTRLRLGVPRTFYAGVDAQIVSAMEHAHDVLKRLTAGLRDVELPLIAGDPFAAAFNAEVYEYHADLITQSRERYQPITLERVSQGANLSVGDYIEAKDKLQRLRNQIKRVFETVDLLITPTVVELPMTIVEARQVPAVEPPAAIRNTLPFNLYGIPSISIPCGFSREGLPIGLQISGPALGELDVLTLAHAFEQATDWRTRQPALT